MGVVAKNEVLSRGGTPRVSAELGALPTVQEVAEILKVPVSWVYEHSRPGCRDPLPCIKVGKYLRFFSSDILDHLKAIRSRNHRRRR